MHKIQVTVLKDTQIYSDRKGLRMVSGLIRVEPFSPILGPDCEITFSHLNESLTLPPVELLAYATYEEEGLPMCDLTFYQPPRTDMHTFKTTS